MLDDLCRAAYESDPTLPSPSSGPVDSQTEPATSRQPRGEVPRDYLTACLALLLAESPCSAEVLIVGLAGLGLGGTERSAVRRALVAMEAEGVIEVAGEHASARAPGRTYRLTPDGVCWLRRWGLRTSSG